MPPAISQCLPSAPQPGGYAGPRLHPAPSQWPRDGEAPIKNTQDLRRSQSPKPLMMSPRTVLGLPQASRGPWAECTGRTTAMAGRQAPTLPWRQHSGHGLPPTGLPWARIPALTPWAGAPARQEPNFSEHPDLASPPPGSLPRSASAALGCYLTSSPTGHGLAYSDLISLLTNHLLC